MDCITNTILGAFADYFGAICKVAVSAKPAGYTVETTVSTVFWGTEGTHLCTLAESGYFWKKPVLGMRAVEPKQLAPVGHMVHRPLSGSNE